MRAHTVVATVSVLVLARVALHPKPPFRDDGCALGGSESPAHAAQRSRLRSRTLHESDVLALPTALVVADDRLAVLDAASDSVLHVVDRMEGDLLFSSGRRGWGPGEFPGAWSLDASPYEEGTLWIYDAALGRSTSVFIGARGSHPPQGRTSRSIVFGDEARLTGPLWSDTGTIASLGFFGGGRLRLYDPAGDGWTRVLGPMPYAGRIPDAVAPLPAHATLVRHPDGRRLAAVNRYASDVEFFDLRDSSYTMVRGPVPAEPDFGKRDAWRSGVWVGADDDPIAYVSGAASERHVFALFSGRTPEDFGTRGAFGRCVHVFDWHGNLEAMLEIDADALAIATDRSGTTLYTLRHKPRPAILAYALGDTLEESLRLATIDVSR